MGKGRLAGRVLVEFSIEKFTCPNCESDMSYSFEISDNAVLCLECNSEFDLPSLDNLSVGVSDFNIPLMADSKK